MYLLSDGSVRHHRLASRGFRIARYGSQPGGLGVAAKVQGQWAACASGRYAALGVPVEALRRRQLGRPATPAARSAVLIAAS
jgi:hypothetical protein